MLIERKQDLPKAGAWAAFGGTLVTAAAVALTLGAGPALAGSDDGFCSATALAQLGACKSEVVDDAFIAKAICLNISNRGERRQCSREAEAATEEANVLCREQYAARRDLCSEIGENRYDPDFGPANFDDPRNPSNPNPYFPLAVGNLWEFEAGAETVTIKVLDKTKFIDGVNCIVVNDVVEEDGKLVEDTDDWFGHRKDGTIDYCGERVQDFEFFEGDDPAEAELTSIDGTFKAGVDGSKPGTLFPGTPEVGAVYRQEWSPGNAEDAARVLSTDYGFGNDSELDEHVPQELVELLCNDDCVVTAEFSPLSPGGLEHKYFARGIGKFLEVNVESGKVSQLVGCNFDPRCDDLPEPGGNE